MTGSAAVFGLLEVSARKSSHEFTGRVENGETLDDDGKRDRAITDGDTFALLARDTSVMRRIEQQHKIGFEPEVDYVCEVQLKHGCGMSSHVG